MLTFTKFWCYVFYVRPWEKHCLLYLFGWVVFLETSFSQLNLKPSEGYLLKEMRDIFVKKGHGITNMIIDSTGFKFQHG